MTSPSSPRKGPGTAHVGRALIAPYSRADLSPRPVVRGKDDQRVVVDAEFLQRVEDLADVDSRLPSSCRRIGRSATSPRKLLRREDSESVPHREWQVEEEGLARGLLPLHEVDRLRHELVPSISARTSGVNGLTVRSGPPATASKICGPFARSASTRRVYRVREHDRGDIGCRIPRRVGRNAIELVEAVRRRQACGSMLRCHLP